MVTDVKAWQMRRFYDYLLLVLSLCLGGYAVLSLRQPWAGKPAGGWLWWLLIAAGLLGGFALTRMERWLSDAQSLARPVSGGSSRFRRVIGLCCFLAAAGLTAWLIWRLWPDYHNWNGTLWPWLVALALTLLGGGLIGTLKSTSARQGQPTLAQPVTTLENRPTLDSEGQPATISEDQPAPTPHETEEGRLDDKIPLWLKVITFILITGLAVFLRTYRIDIIPAGIWADETNCAVDALYILEGHNVTPFGTGWGGTPTAYIYYMAGLFNLLGANYAALKVASLIPAILTVLAIYPLGRLLFGPTGGFSAMFLLAVSRWHLTMSRWGWYETSTPPFQILATFFLIRGLRERRPLDFVLGGLIGGLTMYTYLSSRLVVATLGLFVIYWLLTDSEGPIASWKRNWRGLALFLLAALVAVGPIAVTYIKEPSTFSGRVDEVSILRDIHKAGSYQPLWSNIRDHLKFFYQAGDRNARHNLPGEPQLDPLTGLLFVMGLGYGLLRLRDRRRGLLWLWLVLGLAGGILSSSFESPQAYRTMIVVPAIVLMAGDVLVRLARGLIRVIPASGHDPARLVRYRTLATGLGSVVLAGGLVGVAAWESDIYFGRQADSPEMQGAFNVVETLMAKDVLDALQVGTQVYIGPHSFDSSIGRFLVYGWVKERTGRNTLDDPRPYYQLIRPEIDLPVPDTGHDALFILGSWYWGVMDYFRLFYPEAQIELVRGKADATLYSRARVSQPELAAIQGLTAHFTHANGLVVERTVAVIDADWGQQDVTAAEWRGSLRLEQSGLYDFTSQGNLKVSVDGQPWSGSRYLGRGLHELWVTQSDCQSQGLARLDWITPDGPKAVIPAQAFFRIAPPRQGLTGYYYPNENWQGAPVFTQTSPFLLMNWTGDEPIPGPFSIRFTGVLHVTTDGRYRFRIFADDGARLILDGVVLGEGMIPHQGNSFEVNTDLAAGEHSIEVDYVQYGGASVLQFYWQPPDRDESPVPFGVLSPTAP